MEQIWVSLEQSERFEEMASAAMEIEQVGVVPNGVVEGVAVAYLVSNKGLAEDIQLALDVEDMQSGSLHYQPGLVGEAAACGRER